MAYPIRGAADYWAPGEWNARCSLCNKKMKASWMVRNWQGLYRCPEHNEPRQPQDFVRGIQEVITPPWVQPIGQIFTSFCTLNGQSAIPNFAIPGCMIPGRATISYEDVSNDYQPPTQPINRNLIAGPGNPFITGTGGENIIT
jgi:hypothetical protein